MALFYWGIILLLSSVTVDSVTQRGSLDEQFDVSWAADHVQFVNRGQEMHLTLDQTSGSGFASKNKYLFGNISMQMKLVPGDSAGTVVSYYLSSEGSNHDGLEFEFLGNKSGQPYVLQTNVYTGGKGEREERMYFWFDPTTDFHSYGVVWTPQNILFMVDGVPIRELKNNKAKGVTQAMGVYSSIWNGERWATRGGVDKIDWSHAPFVVAYRNFSVEEATASSGASTVLNLQQRNKLQWVKRNFMISSYDDTPIEYPTYPREGCLPTCK